MPAEFFVHNLGCKVNRVESDALIAALVVAGGRPVEREDARVVVINTCTVTGEAEAKTRKAIRQALAGPCGPWVIATGCAITMDREGYRSLGERVIAEPDRLKAQQTAFELLGLTDATDAGTGGLAGDTENDARLPVTPSCHSERSAAEPRNLWLRSGQLIRSSADALEEGTGVLAGSHPTSLKTQCVFRALGPSASLRCARNDREGEHGNDGQEGVTSSDARTRRGIKIQDGCDNACSYCIVHIARGAARSVPHDELRRQIQAAERDGIREVVLTGVNIGSYRSDGYRLPQLVSALIDATDEARIRLSSLEPQYVSDELLALMASSKGRVCAHLHLPLQSGSDATLSAMARLYDGAFFAERVQHARGLMPQLALTTDLIVGFPGETDGDFEQSMAFCERMGFSRMHVFRYSRRPHTPAATMPGQVPPPLSAMRARTARDLATRMREQDALTRIGTREAVLVERRGRGTSESYHPVAVPPQLVAGSLVSLQITGYRDTLLQATL
jgi:threonylcarbamoyladenosine tRNA methylthiotransferase MtaB